jgi:hypothetical protein
MTKGLERGIGSGPGTEFFCFTGVRLVVRLTANYLPMHPRPNLLVRCILRRISSLILFYHELKRFRAFASTAFALLFHVNDHSNKKIPKNGGQGGLETAYSRFKSLGWLLNLLQYLDISS